MAMLLVVTQHVLSPDTMWKDTRQPEHDKDDDHYAEYAAQASPAVLVIAVVATAAKQQQ
jgi:hypothetical protein